MDLLKAVIGDCIGHDIHLCVTNDGHTGAVLLTYCAIDAMAFLSMPLNQEEIYNKILECLKEFISQKKTDPKYYHNKFFKNDKSIALVRNFFKLKYEFFDEIV